MGCIVLAKIGRDCSQVTGWGYFFYRVRCALWLAWVRLVRWGTILRERGEAAQEYYQ